MEPDDELLERTVLRKVTRRLIPFLFLLYIVAYLDRVNLGLAKLQMGDDLKFDDRVFGLGMAIFFIGYFIFEIPGNLILERFGARRWIGIITILWGVISAGMMFTNSVATLYLLRFLLGLVQAGFFPGMILYLTYWFPAVQRAKAVSRFMTATAVSIIIGGPLSGVLLNLNGVAGLAGWQWLFLVEGLPAVLLGFVVFYYLTDRPHQAHWLTETERSWLVERLQDEEAGRRDRHGHAIMDAIGNRRVWLLTVIYFALAISVYGITFWLPTILKDSSATLTATVASQTWLPTFITKSPDLEDLLVGLLTAIPFVVAAVGMLVVGNHSDQTRERRWHIALSAFTAAAGLALAALSPSLLIRMIGLSMAALGMWSSMGPFWALSTSFLSGAAAAAGIGLINSVGNLGGFVGPYTVGYLKEEVSIAASLVVLAAVPFIMGIMTLCVRRHPTQE